MVMWSAAGVREKIEDRSFLLEKYESRERVYIFTIFYIARESPLGRMG